MASRETHDLFRLVGWQIVLHDLKKWGRPRNGWRILFEDTFMRFVCWFKGHDKYETEDERDIACRRCHKYIEIR